MTAFFWLVLNSLQILFLVLWTLLWLIIALTARWLTGSTIRPLAMAHHPWSTAIMVVAGTRLEVTGLDHLEEGRQYFLAVNHQSMLDIPVLYRALPMPLLFVLKEELGRIPLFGTFLRAMGMVMIRRQAKRQAVQELKGGGRRIAAGHSLVAFPEGTRGDGESIQAFKPGVFVPAIDAGVDVVPIALDGPARLLAKGSIRLRPGVIRMVIGEPIPTGGLERSDRRQLAQQVEDAVRRQWQGSIAQST